MKEPVRITSPEGVLQNSCSVGTVAPVIMEASSPLTRLRWPPKSSAIPIAIQCYLGREVLTSVLLSTCDLLAVATTSVSSSNMALAIMTVSAISWGSFAVATIFGNGLVITSNGEGDMSGSCYSKSTRSNSDSKFLLRFISCVQLSRIALRYFSL